MQALMFEEAGKVTWQHVPEPEMAPHGVLVRPLAVSRCDLDAPMATLGLFPGPFVVGHEVVGEVTATGPDVDLVVGTRVVVPFQVSCGTCGACLAGRTAACTTLRAPVGGAFGFGERGGGHGGGLAELLAVPYADHLLRPAPAEVGDPVLATLPDNVVDAYRAVAPPLADEPGADVLVVAGDVPSIGLYAAAWAVALGAGAVRYVDHDVSRCAAAEALGAAVEHRSGVWPRRYPRARITVGASAEPDGLTCAVRSTDDAGWLTVVSIVFGDATLPLLEMYTRGITVHTSRADSHHHLPAVLDAVAAGRFDPLVVPTTVVNWGDAPEAWLSDATKLVVIR